MPLSLYLEERPVGLVPADVAAAVDEERGEQCCRVGLRLGEYLIDYFTCEAVVGFLCENGFVPGDPLRPSKVLR